MAKSNHQGQTSNAAKGGADNKLTAISAPYNFVPLANWVHSPAWANQVTQDIPFKDGLSGHLDLTITAHTPLLVGGRQKKSTNNAPGEVKPFKMPDGCYAIPGTSLKGMIRSVIEIASFSRMSMVDDIRYGLRDISGKHVSSAYTMRVRSNVRTGFMRLGKNGLPVITPCEMVRLDHRQIEGCWNIAKPAFPASRSVRKKYDQWRKICEKASLDQKQIRFSLSGGKAVDLGQGTEIGVPVFTGQINKSEIPKGKHLDFIFYNENPTGALEMSLQEWADFLFVHGDQATKDAVDMSWPGFWKARYWKGESVPVFYLQDKGKTRIGLAYMPRLSGDFSTHQMINHSSPDHSQGQGRGPLDFAETLFGIVGDKPTDCLKGRVSFGTAVSSNATIDQPTEPTILNGPKASYFPNYVRQKSAPPAWRLRSQGYATCIRTSEHPKPEIRGWKRYPTRSGTKIQQLTSEQKNSDKKGTQVILHPLKEKAVFSGRVTFHNLKPEELGALCWALEWAGNEELRHGLGMAKSFGFGQVGIKISDHAINPNDPTGGAMSLESYRNQFMVHMLQVAHWRGVQWDQTPQIKGLLGMANPKNAENFPGKLEHMRLAPKEKINEFVKAKHSGLVLAEYPQTNVPGIAAIEWEPVDPPAIMQAPELESTPSEDAAPVDRSVEWFGVLIAFSPGSGELSVNHQGQLASSVNPDAQQLRDALPGELKDRLKKRKELKNCRVRIEPIGNRWKLAAILAVGDQQLA